MSYYLSFSNDSREWTNFHDGYSDWVSSLSLRAEGGPNGWLSDLNVE